MRMSAAIVSASLLLAACVNADTVDGPVDMVSHDIVTFAGNDPGAHFLLYAPGADEPSLLRADIAVDTAQVPPGSRVMLAYTAPDADSGTIGVRGVAPINSEILRGAPGVPEGWDADSVWLVSVWRAGQYVDMRLRLPYTAEPRTFALVLDSATLGSGAPRLYLAHRLPVDVEADATFSRSYYASFDISSVWSRPDVTEVTVSVANANIPSKNSFTFEKPTY